MNLVPNEHAQRICSGNRRALAKAITLLESSRADHQQQAQKLLEMLLPESGNALRIGITGVPGVGKSTFIEAFGLFLIEQGHRVAVLAVDPSSPVTGGSILGDKTRMNELSQHPSAFIRPSPSSGVLGGVGRRTRETMLLCEAAGYDVIFVETVGVGQSETLVASMTDCFLVLMLPNAGDELQGIKKGILELADLLVVNKADGEQVALARHAQQTYRQALRLMSSGSTEWQTPVLTISALKQQGLDELWGTLKAFEAQLKESGKWDVQRREQQRRWFWSLVEEALLNRFQTHPEVQADIPQIEHLLTEGQLLPVRAAERLLRTFFAS